MTFSTRIPRVLLTNDDGIDAPGLAVLTEIAHDIADEVWIVAPEHDQSGTGQSLSIHNAIRCPNAIQGAVVEEVLSRLLSAVSEPADTLD